MGILNGAVEIDENVATSSRRIRVVNCGGRSSKLGHNQTDFRGAQNATCVTAHSKGYVYAVRRIFTQVDRSVQNYLPDLDMTQSSICKQKQKKTGDNDECTWNIKNLKK